MPSQFDPKLMVEQEKQQHLGIAQDTHEACVYGYDSETKFQSSEWNDQTSPRPQKPDRCIAMSRSC